MCAPNPARPSKTGTNEAPVAPVISDGDDLEKGYSCMSGCMSSLRHEALPLLPQALERMAMQDQVQQTVRRDRNIEATSTE